MSDLKTQQANIQSDVMGFAIGGPTCEYEELLKHLKMGRSHVGAEILLCKYLRSIGNDDIADAWEQAQILNPRW